jgi:hypothetical protein
VLRFDAFQVIPISQVNLIPLLSVMIAASLLALSTSMMLRCMNSSMPVKVSANTVDFNLSLPANQIELTGLLSFASQTSNLTESIKKGTSKLEATYNIYTQLCVPEGFSAEYY